jgi:hypothetical protein
MTDEAQPDAPTSYGSIPIGDAYREELKDELEGLKIDQDKHPTDYKLRRIMTLSSRLGMTPDGNRRGPGSPPYRFKDNA